MSFEEMYMAVLKIKGKEDLENCMAGLKDRFGFKDIYGSGTEYMVFIRGISPFDLDQVTEWLDNSEEIEDYDVALGTPVINFVKGGIENVL